VSVPLPLKLRDKRERKILMRHLEINHLAAADRQLRNG
jgi:hypothetical protein